MIDDPAVTSIRDEIDEALEQFLPPPDATPETLHRAMRYSVLNGGKRLRPTITVLTGSLFTENREPLLPPACSIEFIHAYSLIHDDLPSMDDDDYRRGVASCHKKFDEATAILAGDALQALAFGILSDVDHDLPVEKLLDELSRAASSYHLVGGQQLDLEWEDREGTVEELQDLHERKTGALITASFRMGVLAGGGSEEDLKRITEAGRPIGLAFQITDDILDVQGSREDLGKTAGKDERAGKLTYPMLLGVDESRRLAEENVEKALEVLDPYGEPAEPLRNIARFILERDH